MVSTRLTDLPFDLWAHIASCLPHRDAAALSLTCKAGAAAFVAGVHLADLQQFWVACSRLQLVPDVDTFEACAQATVLPGGTVACSRDERHVTCRLAMPLADTTHFHSIAAVFTRSPRAFDVKLQFSLRSNELLATLDFSRPLLKPDYWQHNMWRIRWTSQAGVGRDVEGTPLFWRAMRGAREAAEEILLLREAAVTFFKNRFWQECINSPEYAHSSPLYHLIPVLCRSMV